MHLPPPSQAQVWIDFDGTITQQDLLDELIQRHAIDDSWKQIERLWEAGEIGSRQCLQRQLALVRATDAELAALLAQIDLDPGLFPLLGLLDRFQIPRAILSDGIDSFIHQLLARHDVHIPVRSNSIKRSGDDISLICPLQSPDCDSAAAHCKCSSITALGGAGRKSIYIGDGRSDLCPARKVEVVFAKGALAQTLRGEGRRFLPFTTLNDVKRILEQRWAT